MAFVLDTNVLVVADDLDHEAGPKCVEACAKALDRARQRRVVLDDADTILGQYLNNVQRETPTAGALFLLWLLTNQYNDASCERVNLTPLPANGRGYEEFPDDPALASFDPADRVFVAVALTSRFKPQIVNATDTDWWNHRAALKRHKVSIKFTCPEYMARKEV